MQPHVPTANFIPFDLEKMLPEVHNEESRSYFTEAVNCFNARAFRASVVMMACAVFDDIRHKAADFAQFDGTARNLAQKLETVRKHQGSYENDVLNLTDNWGKLDIEQQRYLKHLYEARNQAAHASGCIIDEDEARRMIANGHARILSVRFISAMHGLAEILHKMTNVDMYPAALPYGHEHTTRDELSLCDPAAHWEVINAIVANHESGSPRFKRNAEIFLRWVANEQNSQLQKYLSLTLLERRTLPPSSSWLIEILAQDPAILGRHNQKSNHSVDAALAATINEFSLDDEEREFALREVFYWVMDDGTGRLQLTLDACLRKMLATESFLRALGADHPHLGRARSTLVTATYDHDRAEAFASAAFERWNPGHERIIGRSLDQETAFRLILNLCEAGRAGKTRCQSLVKLHFAGMPSIRQKAIALVNSDPGRAEMLLEDAEWIGYSGDEFFDLYLKPLPDEEDDEFGPGPEYESAPLGPEMFAFLKKAVSAA
ncbi:hypothetical protein ACC808_11645 [Rhizobium ruizarguesonis]|nr:hypothetical protein [Rhizobium rhizogenes]